MFNIAVVEDNAQDRDQILTFLEKSFAEIPEAMESVFFESGETFLQSLPKAYDLVLLDIDMPGISGVETAKRLREQDANVLIIFVTNMYQFALEGYTVRALDFIVKPLRFAGFRESIHRAVDASRREKPAYIELVHERTKQYVDINSIIYVETARKKLKVHLRAETYMCDGPLRDLETRLVPYGFFEIHQSYLVNMRYVKHVGQTDALVGNDLLPVSRHKRKAFMTALADYVGKVL